MNVFAYIRLCKQGNYSHDAHGIARWFTEEHNDAIVFTINTIFVCLLLNMIYSGLFDRK